MKDTARAPRSFDFSIDLDATPEDVWRALTEAGELTRWFATNANITPGPDGTWAIDWEGDWPWTMRIAAWEPLRRLRLVDAAARPMNAHGKPIEGAAATPMAIEFTLNAAGGRTTLRVVHSGFGHGATWDDELDGVSLGWNAELRVLRHYLRYHRGRERRLGWARVVSRLPLPDAWRGLTSDRGLITSGAHGWLHGGDEATITLATGDRFDGRVLFARDGRHLVLAAAADHTLFGFHVDRVGGDTMIQARVSSWSWTAAEVAAFTTRAQVLLNRFAG